MATNPQTPQQGNQLSEPEKNVIIPSTQNWDDKRAYQIASQSFEAMEKYRSMNHDRRFRVSDEMYLAWVRRKNWEGTKVPRSSVPVFMMLQQIEALLPSVVGALFSDDLYFDAIPRPSSTIAQARAVVQLLRYQFSDLSDDNAFTSMREITRRVLKQMFMYGNGIAEFGWVIREAQRLMYERHLVPIRQMQIDPQTGQAIPVPTGQFQSVVKQDIERHWINKPQMQALDVRDFFIDPNCPSHNVQDAADCAVRNLKPVEWFVQFRDQDGFQIPDDKTLLELAKKKQARQADVSKQQSETFRGNSWQPTKDYTEDPNQKNIELVRYYQNDRCVWFVPGYETPLWNQPNNYGIKPFLNACYVDFPGRFYGLSICDLVEGDQRLAEAILNARIDELNLIIHPPIVRKSGSNQRIGQKKLRPGVEWEVDGDPSKDIIRMEWGNLTQNAYVEVAALEQRVQKTTGVTDLAVLGTPTSGGNSANRTATGVNAQSAASSKRMQYQVENLEDQFFIPALIIFHHLNKKFLDPNQLMHILGPDGQKIQLDPIDVLNADVQFSMKASSKMRSKQALQAGGLQFLFQSYMNPEMMQIMAQMGIMPNFEEFDALASDTMGVAPKSLVIPMPPGLLQQMQQNSSQAQEIAARQKMQDDRLVAQGQHQDAANDTKLLIALMQKLLENPQLREKMTGVPDDHAEREIAAKEKAAARPNAALKS